MTLDTGTLNFALAGAFVDELARAGVRHACLCPGSRSTPLAVSFSRQPTIRVWVHIDERSAAFFAVGLARALREPVALLCSSGTAAANFLPAVVEASYSRVPLIVLTADRPPELRDFGAAQTIDQIRLYGGFAKWFVDMPVPAAGDDLLRHARVVAGRAVATARNEPAGPVHLNFPFREPLLPLAPVEAVLPTAAPFGGGRRPNDLPFVVAADARRSADPGAIARLATDLAATERGLIICGPQDEQGLSEAVARLAAALGYPILADPLSQVRCGAHDRSLVVDSYDAFLRDETTSREFVPQVVLRFGAIPTSKPLLLYLQRHAECRQLLIDEAGGWRDPLFQSSDVVHGDPSALCEALAEAVASERQSPPGSEWVSGWLRTAELTRAAIADALAATTDPFEGRVFAELAGLLPEGATIFAGNSMPVRDLDTFFTTTDCAIRFLANRGANGIDGVVSTAIGVAATGVPLVLVIGDLSFYHDLNGLLAAKRHRLRATIVVLNNDGGGIFSFLPQATHIDPATFEELFGTPLDLDVEAAARLYGARFTRPEGWAAFRQAVAAGISGDGLRVIEVRTDRAENVAQHRSVWAAVATRLRERAAIRTV